MRSRKFAENIVRSSYQGCSVCLTSYLFSFAMPKQPRTSATKAKVNAASKVESAGARKGFARRGKRQDDDAAADAADQFLASLQATKKNEGNHTDLSGQEVELSVAEDSKGKVSPNYLGDDDDQDGELHDDDDDDFASPVEDEDSITNMTSFTARDGDLRGGQESWNAMLYQLLLFKSQRGNFNIPHNDPAYRALYNWVQNQRRYYKLYHEETSSSNFMNADRIAVLDAIEFPWNVRGDSFWQKNFVALLAYKREHGDVRVPRLYSKNPKLGEWVTDQRRQWKNKMDGKPSMLTEERKKRLDELGFVWKMRDRVDWNDRYEQLLEFKKDVSWYLVLRPLNSFIFVVSFQFSKLGNVI